MRYRAAVGPGVQQHPYGHTVGDRVQKNLACAWIGRVAYDRKRKRQPGTHPAMMATEHRAVQIGARRLLSTSASGHPRTNKTPRPATWGLVAIRRQRPPRGVDSSTVIRPDPRRLIASPLVDE